MPRRDIDKEIRKKSLKGFKECLYEELVSSHITNSWGLGEHESIKRAFMVLLHCKKLPINKWSNFISFIKSYVDEDYKELFPTVLLDDLAFDYLKVSGVNNQEISNIKELVNRERELASIINKLH